MKIPKIALVLVVFVVATTIAAQAQTNVFVPGNASGYFGRPADRLNPLVSAITVTGPATITVTYVNGTVTDSGGVNTGPSGVRWNTRGAQAPLQESNGVTGGVIHNFDALIGVFVVASRVNRSGFSPVDGTKDVVPVGIRPGGLFFIGTGMTFSVTQPGTLYLGINDWAVGDNGGGFNVTVSVQ